MKYILCALLLTSSFFSMAQELSFTNVSEISGLDYKHSFTNGTAPMTFIIGGGSATGDIDNDGYLDLFFTLGNEQNGVMMHNQGDGTFEELENFSGANSFPLFGSGPLFFDYNQDEYIDLIIGSHFKEPPVIFINNGDLTFTKIDPPEFQSLDFENTITITAMDYNLDGYQDLFMSHWLEVYQDNHFWKNNGDGTFTSVDSILGFYNPFLSVDNFHATNFSDINGDNYPDLLACSDFETSQIWINKEGKSFELDTLNNLVDENAMGGTVADFDNDGDMDWYMTNIFDNDGVIEGNWGTTGNKLYVNDGTGIFTEKAKELGVENTDWGWGTSFSDFNNDGYLDIIATNGWPNNNEQFLLDPTKIFLSENADTFIDATIQVGLLDSLQGRGLSTFDYDLDGDLDVFITNINGPVALWRNDLVSDNNYINITLTEPEINRMALGAKITVFTNEHIQLREIKCGSNYTSQDPMNAHFGLGTAEIIDSIVVRWQDGSIQSHYGVAVNQHLNLTKLNVSVDPVDSSPINSKIFPNPSLGNLTIEFEFGSHLKQPNCLIYNAQGQLIDQIDDVTLRENSLSFHYNSAQELPLGTYFAVLTSEGDKIVSLSFVLY